MHIFLHKDIVRNTKHEFIPDSWFLGAGIESTIAEGHIYEYTFAKVPLMAQMASSSLQLQPLDGKICRRKQSCIGSHSPVLSCTFGLRHDRRQV